MKLKSILLRSGITSLLSLSLILSGVPASGVLADELFEEDYSDEYYEEDYSDDSYEEDSYEDASYEDDTYEEADQEEEITSLNFMITRFPDFEKDSDGHFVKEETKKKYEKITAKQGTKLEDLKLPEDLKIEGYFEGNPSMISTEELEDIEWKLDSDEKTYDEFSPAGEYTFVPDYEEYLLENFEFDDITLAEGVKDLKLKVTITSDDTVCESSDELISEDSDFFTDSDSTDDSFSENTDSDSADFFEDNSNDGSVDYFDDSSDNGSVDFFDDSSDDGSVDFFDGSTDDGSVNFFDSENSDTDSGIIDIPSSDDSDELFADGSGEVSSDSEDIFSNIDDSVLIIGDQSEESDFIIISEPTGGDVPVEEPKDEPVEEPVKDPEETTFDEPVIDPSETTLEGYFTITDGTTSVTNPVISVLEPAAVVEITNSVSISDIPCKVDVSNITITLDGTTIEENLDFSSSNTVSLDYDNNGVIYPITFVLTVNEHQWNTATCTEPATCLNCGKTTGSASAHVPSGKATCTSNDVCSICGEEIPDTKTSHNWVAATCRAPKTCTICHATEGKPVAHISANNATCTKNATCVTCGSEIADTKLGHNWIKATCKTPKICTRCGKTDGDALGHKIGKNPTCTKNAVCGRCGEEIAGTATGHKWVDATCTTPRTCSVCKATDGSALGHSFSEWTVVSNSTDSEHGIKQRECTRTKCSTVEKQYLNIIADSGNNAIYDISEGQNFELNTKITFTAYGSGMNNAKPIEGDVRYIPSAWSIQGTPGKFKEGYTGTFSITQAGSYALTATFQKQVYSGDQWTNTNDADSRTVNFTVGQSSSNGTQNAVRITPQTGDSTPIIPIVIALIAALAVIVGLVVYKIVNR